MTQLPIYQLETVLSYGATAGEYTEKTFGLDVSASRETFLSYLPPHALIMEPGCAHGRDALAFAKAGHRVVAFDPVAELIDIAREKAIGMGGNPTFYVLSLQDVNELGLEGKCDGLFSMAVHIHFAKSELNHALALSRDQLKPGGVMFLSMKRGEGEGMEFDKRYGVDKYFAYYHDDEIAAHLQQVGLDIVEFEMQPIRDDYATNPWMNIVARRPE